MENKKGNFWKVLCSVIGALVLIGSAAVTIVHFWDDIKKHLPCCRCKTEPEDCCEEPEEPEEVEAPAEEAPAEEEVPAEETVTEEDFAE